MKKRKIIHIEHRAYGSYFPKEDSEYYYLAGWSSAVARQTVKYTNRYTIGNWRPEREIKKPIFREVQGIICRLFPPMRRKRFKDWSPTMLRELRRQVKKNEILIHHSSIHSNSLYLIASIFRNTPIVAQHHGDSSPLIRFKQNRKISTLLSYSIERICLKNIDHFFVLRKSEMEFLSKFVPKSRISVQTMGVDFEEFKPVDKVLARQKLGLPLNKKIILYVGKFYKLKSVDIILKTFQELKRKYYDIELILIGGYSTDHLYDDVRSSGARFYGYLPHNELPLYFSAADVYLLPAFSKKYAGIDVAAIESLACGTPIVSTTLEDFPTNEWKKLGKIPRDEKDTVRCVSEMLANAKPFKNCREAAKKYYDWKNIIRRTVEVYDRLFEKYYKNK